MFDVFFSEFNLQTFLFLSVACFAASFIDAIAGGGGLISVPAFVASGLPIHVAMGSNKMAASFSTLGSAVKYFTSGKINFSLMKYPMILGATGAVLGACVVSNTSEEILEPLIFIMLLAVIIYTFDISYLHNKHGWQLWFIFFEPIYDILSFCNYLFI